MRNAAKKPPVRASSNSSSHADAQLNDGAEPLSIDEQIRRRAYELYLERGKQPSDGMGDWVQAEREFYERP